MESKHIRIGIKAIKKKGEIILHLKDNEGHEHDKTITSDANPGSKITWSLAEDSDIIQIVDIYKKEGSMNIYSVKPHAVEGSTDWEAIVSNQAFEKAGYNIDFRYKDGKIYRDDPEVEVRPPKG
ncbi:hypothetical protein [Labilibacter marinus]|uniref:hypothetical protein n=1 Tax=Labilibacter marinus TaxID=1477105 RepID=UPI00082EF2F5|nr:hypothetical protein [Labilibacter marinus]